MIARFLSRFPFSNLLNKLCSGCVNKTTSRERAGGVDKPAHEPAHSGGWRPLISMSAQIMSLLSFKTLMAKQHLQSWFWGGHWVHDLPKLLAFWLKALFPSIFFEYVADTVRSECQDPIHSVTCMVRGLSERKMSAQDCVLNSGCPQAGVLFCTEKNWVTFRLGQFGVQVSSISHFIFVVVI